ncbi:hypothetical protein [Undibacterium sp. Di24W]|uniref:hypothetical protein n=1 Tax=Undibacterium sp. Di24W TaxID=3413033 RepID=UPI003BF30175
MILFEGFHGTSLDASKSIVGGQFLKSESRTEWLGHGVYFFVEGISCPLQNAQDWAICQAWDKENCVNLYDDFGVLKSEIQLGEDELIDLTCLSGLQAFNATKAELYSALMKHGIQLAPQEEHNCILFNFMVDVLEVKAVKHHLYIKNKRERRAKLDLNVPNTTVCCLVDLGSIAKTEIVVEGKIK